MAEDDWDAPGRAYNVKSTGDAPMVVHGNGKSDIWKVWDAMGV
jgi:hypothetical protein